MSCSGFKAINIWIVEQFGFAIIRSSGESSDALISGITNFFEGSILQAEELSTTLVPTSANFGAQTKEVSPPAEKRARSGFKLTASSNPITLNDLLLN